MSHTDPWIWLPRALYPDAQTSVYNAHGDMTGARFAVAEFVRAKKPSVQMTLENTTAENAEQAREFVRSLVEG